MLSTIKNLQRPVSAVEHMLTVARSQKKPRMALNDESSRFSMLVAQVTTDFPEGRIAPSATENRPNALKSEKNSDREEQENGHSSGLIEIPTCIPTAA